MVVSPRALLAVDFGTSNTVAVLARGGETAEPLLFDGSPALPSAVMATGGSRFLVGRDAQRAAAADPARLEPNPKRRVDDAAVLLGDEEHPVGDLIAAVLRRVVDTARQVTGGDPDAVVLTHPAGWGATRRRVLVDAALGAGLHAEPVLVAEPVAAAELFSDRSRQSLGEGRAALVYDLGAGTCDLTVLVRRDGRVAVAATDGMNDVGGLDVDHVIVEHLRATHPDPNGWGRLSAPATPNDRRQRRTLWEDVRSAKELLSRESRAAVHIPVLDTDTHLTRAELEQLVRPLLRPTAKLAGELVRGAGVELDRVYLTGGASRMPLVATELLRELDITPTLTEQPELVIALGAARWARPAAVASGPEALTSPEPERAVPTPAASGPLSGTEAAPATPPPTVAMPTAAPGLLRRRSVLFGGIAAVGAAAAGLAGYLLWPRGTVTITARGRVDALAFSPDGSALAVGGERGIQLCDTESGAELWSSKGSVLAAALVFEPTGKTLISGSGVEILRWDAGSGERAGTGPGYATWAIDQLAVDSTGELLTDGHRLYEPDTDHPLPDVEPRSNDFSPDGGRLVTVGDKGIAVTRVPGADWDVLGSDATVAAVFGAGGSTIVTATETEVVARDTDTGEVQHAFTEDATRMLARDERAERIATVGTGGVRLWDGARGDRITTVTETIATIVAMDPKGSKLAVAGLDGTSDDTVQVWTL